jgi:hypothetical protein
MSRPAPWPLARSSPAAPALAHHHEQASAVMHVTVLSPARRARSRLGPIRPLLERERTRTMERLETVLLAVAAVAGAAAAVLTLALW